VGGYIDNGDGTVTDTATGLMWQQGTVSAKNSWQTAMDYAETLSLSGFSDWRLPDINELQSLVDYSRWNPAIDTSIFPGIVWPYYWTSTTYTYTSGTYIARVVGFENGNTGGFNKLSGATGVRAVRGGQPYSLGSLVISEPRRAASWNIDERKTIIWDTANISGNVKITLSRQGGKTGTFETIIESTENKGTYN
jgi:hypothetical protein